MTSPTTRPKTRREIQLLRALAVLAVVVAHVWPERLPGGFAGVDVFFVVSGYLITNHLLGELRRTGGIRLGTFWARRIRRLLPAALTVLLVCLALTMLVIPAPMRSESLTQILASVFYVQNWALALTSTDYFAAEQSATLVQHFWSLSVEEQFYIVWPLLLLTLWGVTRARKSRVLLAILVVAGASLVLSIVQSYSADASAAYFSTGTRIWEFCAGAVIALAPGLTAGALPERFRELRRWSGLVGVAAILVSFVVMGPQTAFPGYAALLPVVGTMLVIIGGAPRERLSIGPIARFAPISVLGDISYSLYLWHWPLVVIAPTVLLGVGGLNATWRVAIVVLSILLAYATKRWIEDPFRRPRAGSRTWQAFLIPVVGGAAALGLVFSAQTFVIAPAAAASAARMDELRASGCFGAQGVLNGCDDPFGPALTIDPAIAEADRTVACSAESSTSAPKGSLAHCDYPVQGESKRGVLALVGDSHAGSVASAVARWATAQGWTLRLYDRSACAVFGANAELKYPNNVNAATANSAASWNACVEFGNSVQREIVEDDEVSAVLLTAATRSYLDLKAPETGAMTTASVETSIDAFAGAGKQVVMLRDVPGLEFGTSAPMCLSANLDNPEACAAEPSSALPTADPLVRAATNRSVEIIDLAPYFCDDAGCYAAIGGVVAYWDRAHLTASMLESLTPMLEESLTEAFRTSPSRVVADGS